MDSDDFEELPKRAASAKGHAAMDDAEEASDEDTGPSLRTLLRIDRRAEPRTGTMETTALVSLLKNLKRKKLPRSS